MTSKPNLNLNLKPTKIERIEFTPEQQDLINKIQNREPIKITKSCTRKDGLEYEYTRNKPLSLLSSKRKLRQIYGGICCICGNCPQYKVVYDAQGAKKIARYCSPCFDKWKDRL